MMESHEKYAPQPAYNEFLVPSCPPSYSEAVGASAPGKPLYPVPPPIPPEYNSPPIMTQSVVVPSPIMTGPVAVGPHSSHITCPGCHAQVKSKTKCVSQKGAHIACCLLCIFGCCLCSCIPYCMKSFQNVNHYCPNCNTFLGVYKN